VKNKLYILRDRDGQWQRTPLETPSIGSFSAHGIDPDESDDYFLMIEDFLTPSSLYLGTVGKSDREQLKRLPEFFRAEGLDVLQYEAVSKDGTKIPYFLVSRKGLVLNAANPTLLYGYGGFEIALTPHYNASVGAAWLEQGGVYAMANIRGGGESPRASAGISTTSQCQKPAPPVGASGSCISTAKLFAPAGGSLQLSSGERFWPVQPKES
jgi:prolyl oligopeptidase